MSERMTRWTAFAALGTSILALGLVAWSTGCEYAQASTKDDPGAGAAPPSVAKAVPKDAPRARDSAERKGVTAGAETKAEAPEVKPAKSEPAASAAPVTDLVLKRIVVTHEVQNREPVTTDQLTVERPIVTFLELANPGSDDEQVVITYEREGVAPVGHVKLNVPAEQPRWRTWGQSRRVTSSGEWVAVATTSSGVELGRQKFEVTKPDAGEPAELKSPSKEPQG